MTPDWYPDDNELDKIEHWAYKDIVGMMGYIKERWKYADSGYWKKHGNTYWISTGGWSGNESLVGAMRENYIFWAMCWWESRRGGHYIFKIPKIREKT